MSNLPPSLNRSAAVFVSFSAHASITAICSRVAGWSGLNVVGEVPFTIPACTGDDTYRADEAGGATSVKGVGAELGFNPSVSILTHCGRVTGPPGRKVPSGKGHGLPMEPEPPRDLGFVQPPVA